jgi:hypothetical protein
MYAASYQLWHPKKSLDIAQVLCAEELSPVENSRNVQGGCLRGVVKLLRSEGKASVSLTFVKVHFEKAGGLHQEEVHLRNQKEPNVADM